MLRYSPGCDDTSSEELVDVLSGKGMLWMLELAPLSETCNAALGECGLCLGNVRLCLTVTGAPLMCALQRSSPTCEVLLQHCMHIGGSGVQTLWPTITNRLDAYPSGQH